MSSRLPSISRWVVSASASATDDLSWISEISPLS